MKKVLIIFAWIAVLVALGYGVGWLNERLFPVTPVTVLEGACACDK